ncbi:hypothetical protein ACFQV2_38145 [Actinokineospora soli]|uniref:Uncharacterized protein n=1 Tax=Actinokineospora soli TaxID=1048753 RepID=A0ABW2TWQ2_9PSEU
MLTGSLPGGATTNISRADAIDGVYSSPKASQSLTRARISSGRKTNLPFGVGGPPGPGGGGGPAIGARDALMSSKAEYTADPLDVTL